MLALSDHSGTASLAPTAVNTRGGRKKKKEKNIS